ncbi:MAG: PAS domain S-box protein, partial [Gammaproteobacteria bacterium]|nr:PAS domain S-box protein [Gammaproteobacteria bacterium]
YRGERVLAAYEPVSVLDLGLVAKIDLSEIRGPFIQTGIISLSLGFIIVLISSWFFFRISEPISQKIEQQAETFRTLAETAGEGIILINTDGHIQYINPSAEAMFGYTRDELVSQSVNRLMPVTIRKSHDQYIANYLESGVGKIIGIGRQLVGQRKDGSQFPMNLSIGDINLKHTRLFAGVIMDLSDQQKLQREIMEVPVREQRRIGQELHDGIGQQLTGLGMLAGSLVNKASKPEYELASQLSNGLQEALAQVRALSRGLVPIEIDATGFIQALRNLTEEIRRQSHIPVTLDILKEIEFTNNDMVMHLYRVAQEALNNAIKHAEASMILVVLDIDGKDGILQVYDNGRGIPDDVSNFDGLGLSIMKYRCSLFEGEIKIDPAESGGTRVRCRFPLKKARETT